MLKRFHSTWWGLFISFVLICVVPLIAIQLLQKWFDSRISYGNCGTGTGVLCWTIISFLAVCCLACFLFPVFVGISKNIFILCSFWTGLLAIIIFFLITESLYAGVLLLVWTVVWLVVSRSNIILFLFLPACLIFLYYLGGSYGHNVGTLTRQRVDQHHIWLTAFIVQHYTEVQGAFRPDDSEWLVGFTDYYIENWNYQHPIGISRYSFNKNLVNLASTQICPEALFVFEWPLENSAIIECPDAIKITEKKFIRVVTFDGNLFCYIPAQDRFIPVNQCYFERYMPRNVRDKLNIIIPVLRKSSSDGKVSEL